MPTVINSTLFDLLPFVLKSRSDKHCYLCNDTLDKPKRVEIYPLKYQICCSCRKMVKMVAKNRLSYEEVCDVVERTADKIILSRRIRKKDFSKLEWYCVRLCRFQEKKKIVKKFQFYIFTL